MALNLIDRLLTIVVTATVTSAVWVVSGGGFDLSSIAEDTGGRIAAATDRAGSTGAARVAHPTPIDKAATLARGTLLIPVAGLAEKDLVDTFTDAREGGVRLHDAIDIMAPTGTPVVAASGGTVEKLFQSDQGGKTIYVRSPDRRTIHYYAHLDAYAPTLREGAKIQSGAPLGTVGWSGNASPDAPHLHFAVLRTTPQANWWEPATAVNPYPLLSRNNR